MKELQYLRTVLSRHGEMGGVSKRVVKGRRIMEAFTSVMKSRYMTVTARRGLGNNILLPALT